MAEKLDNLGENYSQIDFRVNKLENEITRKKINKEKRNTRILFIIYMVLIFFILIANGDAMESWFRNNELGEYEYIMHWTGFFMVIGIPLYLSRRRYKKKVTPLIKELKPEK